MKFPHIPMIYELSAAGPDDRIFDALLLLGPTIILLVSVVGRNQLTTALAGLYLVSLLGYIVYRGGT